MMMRATAIAWLLTAGLIATAAADAPTHDLSLPGGHRLRADVRGSFVITDKRGAPDAIRMGGSVGGLILRRGLFDVSGDVVGVFGFSEKIGHSYRFGGTIELDRRLPTLEASVYVSAGAHYFVSRAAEDRTGGLGRVAVGFRIMTSKHVYVGFEPIAIERIPAGKGIQTPVRTRWAWEMTFLSVGFRP